ncbi:2Fe-2S iron-sulfur cluster-binding protein [Xanthobacter tagetidis]|uniref:Carbon monoxide dehydrogenase n=3 Tax=Xanthobacter tagetidis TaxID=60216 RepID=A0A3L7ADG6_9HYPH|nr:2Fe-2S iron-sulfur cluster-binding protein [Xanthobacter tagetidis]MBB6305901.1 carbon-monoxide dehydrogenase small subunit [Xanthobacter tagetidis]RLP78423.1 carbon monoxide dehydrogenase [Xanthobacter tagetidis]
MTHTIRLRVNDVHRAADVEPRTSLADFLRDACGLTGTHLGCEHGVCGACTVLLDGAPVRGCLTYAVQADDRAVETVEGFADDAIVADLRTAFSRHHALQCGFCTPGMLVTAQDIVRRLGAVDEARIREELSGNLCRCTGYAGIVRAIAEVAARHPQGGAPRAGAVPAVPEPVARTPRPPVQAAPAPAAAPSAARTPAVVSREGAGFRVDQEIIIRHPLDAVWSALADPAAVAACLPGAEITRQEGDALEGVVQVRMGPIRARFEGAATYQRDAAAHRGTVEGGGRDSLSGSRIAGRMAFAAAAAEPGATRLRVELAFTLQGMLAQFSRPAIVSDFTAYMVGQFADNLDRRLAGDLSAAATGPMDALKMLRWWIGRLLRR